MPLSPPILTLLEVSKSTWKSADPVRTRMEETFREEGGCVVVVEVTRAVQEAAREEVALLVADEEQREAVASLRLHDALVKHPKGCEPLNHQPRDSSNRPTSLFTLDLDPRYQHSKAPSGRFQYDLLNLPLSSIASAVKMSCRLHLLTILLVFTAALVTRESTVATIPRCTQVCRLRRCSRGTRPCLHNKVAGFVNISDGHSSCDMLQLTANYASWMYIVPEAFT